MLGNIAESLDDEQKTKIAADLVRAFEIDLESRKPWEAMHAEWISLYYQMDKPKNPPWQGSSTEGLPLLVEGCTQFHARALKAMFPNDNILTCIPTVGNNPEIAARAKRVAQHMSWQLMIRDTSYKSNKDRLLGGLPLHGSFFTKTYYHPLLGRNVVENVRPEDFVVPYGVGPRDIEQIERKTHIIPQSLNDAAILAKAGWYLEGIATYDGTPSTVQKTIDRAQGTNDPFEKAYGCVLEIHCIIDLDGDGIAEPYIAWIDRSNRKLLRLAARWAMDPQGNPTDNMRPVEYFTAYHYINNPNGFYGLGMGHLIGPINKAANRLLRQYSDGNTLATVGNMSGFISSQLSGTRGGDVELSMGKFRKLDVTADDISRGIFQMKFPPPPAGTVEILNTLMMRSDRLATVTEAITGQIQKVVQPTALAALIEQSMEVFSAVYDRVITSWGEELRKIYALNAQYLPDQEIYGAIAQDGRVQPAQVMRADYTPDLLIRPLADPKMVSKEQRMAKADAEFQTLVQMPQVQSSPEHFYNVVRRRLEAMEVPNIDEVWPKPAPPERVDDPKQENMGALLPVPHMAPAFLDQDHITHIQFHKQLAEGGEPGYSEHLLPDGKKALEDHIQIHIAMLYGVNEGNMLNVLGEGAAGFNIPNPPPESVSADGVEKRGEPGKAG